jgi:hypothetical protein
MASLLGDIRFISPILLTYMLIAMSFSSSWPTQSAQGAGDDILLQIRNRFANPEHSKVPLDSTSADDAGIRKMMVRSTVLLLTTWTKELND